LVIVHKNQIFQLICYENVITTLITGKDIFDLKKVNEKLNFPKKKTKSLFFQPLKLCENHAWICSIINHNLVNLNCNFHIRNFTNQETVKKKFDVLKKDYKIYQQDQVCFLVEPILFLNDKNNVAGTLKDCSIKKNILNLKNFIPILRRDFVVDLLKQDDFQFPLDLKRPLPFNSNGDPESNSKNKREKIVFF
ncbi:hypothetical protein HK099_008254, partial [Clydaea vesicula]